MNKQKTINELNSLRNKILTKKGGWEIGKGVTSHGYSLLDELVGNASFFQVLMLNVTGRLPEKKLAQWLEATFICLSWPDPRIWCNQIGTYGGMSQASPTASICAGVLASDSTIYGPGTVIAATRFIVNAVSFIEQGASVAQYIEKHAKTRLGLQAPGYARPVAKGDERVAAMAQLANNLGFTTGKHLATAYEIERHLITTYDESMNLAGYIMAFLTDQRFSETEIHRIYSICVSGGIHACYAESFDKPEDSFLPLRCEDIEYIGADHRPVPH